MKTPPENIETRRLNLRKPRLDDLDAVFAYAGDAETTRYMAWSRHESTEDSRTFLIGLRGIRGRGFRPVRGRK